MSSTRIEDLAPKNLIEPSESRAAVISKEKVMPNLIRWSIEECDFMKYTELGYNFHNPLTFEEHYPSKTMASSGATPSTDHRAIHQQKLSSIDQVLARLDSIQEIASLRAIKPEAIDPKSDKELHELLTDTYKYASQTQKPVVLWEDRHMPTTISSDPISLANVTVDLRKESIKSLLLMLKLLQSRVLNSEETPPIEEPLIIKIREEIVARSSEALPEINDMLRILDSEASLYTMMCENVKRTKDLKNESIEDIIAQMQKQVSEFKDSAEIYKFMHSIKSLVQCKIAADVIGGICAAENPNLEEQANPEVVGVSKESEEL